MNLSPRLSEAAVGSRLHPFTGEPIVPLGFTRSGKLIWPVLGAADTEDDDSDDSEDDAADDDQDDSDDSESDESDDEDESELDKKATALAQAKIDALDDEKNRHVRQRKKAEQRADELQAELDKVKNKDLPAVEKLTKERDELRVQRDDLEEKLKQARLENAFLSDNTYTWHNPSRALQVADLSDVDFDDDGKVHGLKAALDELARSDPYLINTDDSSDDKKKKAGGPKTGDEPGKKKPTNKTKERSALLEKYSALRR
jgi:FtsZ-binding cell division protein ZapB